LEPAAAASAFRRLEGKVLADLVPHDRGVQPVIEGDATLLEAASVMVRARTPVIAVLDDDELIGGITIDEVLSHILAPEAADPGQSREKPVLDVLPAARSGELTVTGELDLSTAPELETAIMEHFRPGSRVTLDLGGVTFIDSAGVHCLIAACKRSGHAIVLRNTTPLVRRVLEIALPTPVADESWEFS
jgi:anti-anti-sigma factor